MINRDQYTSFSRFHLKNLPDYGDIIAILHKLRFREMISVMLLQLFYLAYNCPDLEEVDFYQLDSQTIKLYMCLSINLLTSVTGRREMGL